MTDLPVPPCVRWSADGSAVEILDQTLLPMEEKWLRLETVEETAEAIRALRVRGAPAIGIAAAMGLAVATERVLREEGPAGLGGRFATMCDVLGATRPTGRNLGWALARLGAAFRAGAPDGAEAAVQAVRAEAERVLEEEARMCQRIAEAGIELLPQEGATVLTHCNAGALATAALGTALAPVYLARGRGIPVAVAACETRPVLQGARLTAWELRRAGVEATVITDSMAGALMKAGRVNLVIVGADRIAANGDTANKIGTYTLAVLASHHGIPFYVAAPRSTFDPDTPNGEAIRIEERAPDEIRRGMGRQTAPEDVRVWNPAFDVTPAHLITAFVTDGGILRPPFEPAIGRLIEGAQGPAAEAQGTRA